MQIQTNHLAITTQLQIVTLPNPPAPTRAMVSFPIQSSFVGMLLVSTGQRVLHPFIFSKPFCSHCSRLLEVLLFVILFIF